MQECWSRKMKRADNFPFNEMNRPYSPFLTFHILPSSSINIMIPLMLHKRQCGNICSPFLLVFMPWAVHTSHCGAFSCCRLPNDLVVAHRVSRPRGLVQFVANGVFAAWIRFLSQIGLQSPCILCLDSLNQHYIVVYY